MQEAPACSTEATPQVYTESAGWHNSDQPKGPWKIIKGASYRDCSTVLVLPTPTEFIHFRVEAAIDGLLKPMNQKFVGPVRMTGKTPLEQVQVVGCEVGDAYNQALAMIAANDELKTYKFMLTVEHDNLPPPDGLMRLLARMYENCERDDEGRLTMDENGIPRFHFLAIGGLYFTKGEPGQPQIYGNPKEFPVNFRPQPVIPDSLQECRGTAMGFTIYNLQALLKDKRLGPPWFETKCEMNERGGAVVATQDLQAANKGLAAGYRYAIDTSIKVGHLDFKTGLVW